MLQFYKAFFPPPCSFNRLTVFTNNGRSGSLCFAVGLSALLHFAVGASASRQSSFPWSLFASGGRQPAAHVPCSLQSLPRFLPVSRFPRCAASSIRLRRTISSRAALWPSRMAPPSYRACVPTGTFIPSSIPPTAPPDVGAIGYSHAAFQAVET